MPLNEDYFFLKYFETCLFHAKVGYLKAPHLRFWPLILIVRMIQLQIFSDFSNGTNMHLQLFFNNIFVSTNPGSNRVHSKSR